MPKAYTSAPNGVATASIYPSTITVPALSDPISRVTATLINFSHPAPADVDVLLTFSAPGAAPKGLSSTGDPRFNRLWTLMGVPCVNVPAIVVEGGLPVGVQVIARFGDDAGALAAARFLEEALARS